MTNLSAIILAAGLGKRMKSSTPKVLHRVLGRAILETPIEIAISLGADPIVVVVGHSHKEVEQFVCNRFPDSPITFALQAEQLGTGHAVMCGLEAGQTAEGRTLVLNGDLPNLRPQTLERLVAQTQDEGCTAGLLTVELDDPAEYGRIVRDDSGRLLRIVENRDASADIAQIREINVGTYLFDSMFLKNEIQSLTATNAQGELYLTDLIEKAAQQEGVCVVQAADPGEVAGVNSRIELATASQYARNHLNRRLMKEGVTLIDPDRTYVEAGVTVEPDVVIWPGVVLAGETTIDTGVEIETGAVIRDSHISSDARILAYSHIEGARVGEGAHVGPFGRLRPGAILHRSAKVGNFVEVKKSTLGEGTKANHLAYVGDATVGKRVNISAGVITCNYDGYNKNPTIIEDDAFIGSDCQLIAPVTVCSKAYVAAGSTIVRDVPADCLAIARGRQINKEGLAEKLRKKAANRG